MTSFTALYTGQDIKISGSVPPKRKDEDGLEDTAVLWVEGDPRRRRSGGVLVDKGKGGRCRVEEIGGDEDVVATSEDGESDHGGDRQIGDSRLAFILER